jgi:hypothetical protein
MMVVYEYPLIFTFSRGWAKIALFGFEIRFAKVWFTGRLGNYPRRLMLATGE